MQSNQLDRCSSGVEDGVGPCFDGPIASLRRVLILMVRFRMSAIAVAHSEDVFNFVGNFNWSIITDDFAQSSPKSDVVFQSVDKLLGGLHGVYI